MKRIKNFVVSFSLSILFIASLCGVILFGLVILEKGIVGRYYTAVQISKEDNLGEALADRIYDYIGKNEYDAVTELSKIFKFKYSVEWGHLSAMMGNAEVKELVAAGAEKYIYGYGDSNQKDCVIYILADDVKISGEVVYRLANYFSQHPAIVIVVALFSLIFLVLSFISLIVYASTVYKCVFAILVAGAIELFAVYYLCETYQKGIMNIIVAEKIILLIVVLYYLFHFNRLQKKVSAIGNLSESSVVGTKGFPYSMKGIADEIDIAGSNLSKAVEEKIKSERLKSELISNVSHDIKTPLTSIINFSDLICSEKTENEKITKYSEHLHEQSMRMKDLLETLIEASKVSSGAVDINLVPCNVQTLLEQSVVEYEGKFSEKDITLNEVPPEEPVYINADVVALSRIFDNLLTNIVKYAAEGSTAYIEPEVIDNRVTISFRNVPKEPIRISTDELTERFVRGDTSRHSEGHGLGLSIVYDLMELMGGKLILSANSVMFEAKLSFEKVEKEEI